MKTDTITTIDRYKSSPAYGQKVWPAVILLDKPRAGYDPKQHITGAVAHGQEVEIVDKQQAHDDLWCLVRCDIEHEGEVYHQEGWCKRQLLENEGASYFEEVNK